MSHIHLPDGVIPPVWWVTGWVICIVLVWLFARKQKGDEVKRKIPFVGVIGALMLIFMSIPLGFLPVHLSLAVLCGILAGPELGFIAVFVVNTILALMGHGGFTTIGLNVLLMGGEAVLGYYLFRAMSGKTGYAMSAIIANIIALLLSTALMVLIVGSAAGLTEVLPIHSHGGEHEAATHLQFLSLTGWSALAIIVLIGTFIESIVTGLIVQFFSKVRPDLLTHTFHD